MSSTAALHRFGTYGVTPQSAVAVTAATAIATTVFSAAATGMWAFSSSTVAKKFQPRINQLVVDVGALKTAVNLMRTDIANLLGVNGVTS